MKQQLTTINILGTTYTILKRSQHETPKMESAAGLCENYSHEIYIDTDKENYKEPPECFNTYLHKILRHEAFHALFYECGMNKYSEDEDLVEALAILYPKLKVIMTALDALEIEKIGG